MITFTLDKNKFDILNKYIQDCNISLYKSLVTVESTNGKTDEELILAIEQILPETFYSYRLRNLCRNEFLNESIHVIDYTSVKNLTKHLQRKDFFTKGRLTKVEYYEEYDQSTDIGTNLLLRVDMIYIDNPTTKFTISRTTTRTWITTDGLDGISTLSEKFYTVQQAIEEAVIRRKNIILNLKIVVPYLIMQTEQVNITVAQQMGIPLFITYGSELKAYEEVRASVFYETTLNSISQTQDYDWLNNQISEGVTIKDYIINEMNY